MPRQVRPLALRRDCGAHPLDVPLQVRILDQTHGPAQVARRLPTGIDLLRIGSRRFGSGAPGSRRGAGRSTLPPVGEGEIRFVDLLVAAILGIAVLRGLFLGLIREAFSIGALAAACLAVRLWDAPLAALLGRLTGGELGGTVAPWVAGAVLAAGAIAAAAVVGRLVHRGARAAGLGWADRAGGAALGLAEGSLVAAVLLVVAIAVLGRGHDLLAGSHSLDALERLERIAAERNARAGDVAAPPPETRRRPVER